MTNTETICACLVSSAVGYWLKKRKQVSVFKKVTVRVTWKGVVVRKIVGVDVKSDKAETR